MPNAVGGLFHALEGYDTGSFLGTCFTYRDSRVVVTAAHCVGNLPQNEIVVVWSPGPVVRRASAVTKHPEADIAVVTVPAPRDPLECFSRIIPYQTLGEDFYAVGFTEVAPPNAPRRPLARLYKGHFQTFYAYESFFGYRYAAGEISIPAPGGLSGGPVFLPRDQQTVVAMVTENVNSALVLDSVEEVSDDGKEYKALYQSISRFGVVLMLAPIAEWLGAQVAQITAAF
jgi:Trypsin-like peptidase domain